MIGETAQTVCCIDERKGWFCMLAGILWTVVVILVVLWLLGLLFHVAGALVWWLLVIAAIVVLINLFTGRRTVV
jgi:hypothetical protein